MADDASLRRGLERHVLDHPEFETSIRGHGHIGRRRVWSAPVPATTRFPHASCFVIVERESWTLDDARVSIETRFYVTDLTEKEASVEHLLRLVRGHWSIESLHRVRDNTFDEDRSQVRTGTLPRVLAHRTQPRDRDDPPRERPNGQHRGGNPSARHHARSARDPAATLQMTLMTKLDRVPVAAVGRQARP